MRDHRPSVLVPDLEACEAGRVEYVYSLTPLTPSHANDSFFGKRTLLRTNAWSFTRSSNRDFMFVRVYQHFILLLTISHDAVPCKMAGMPLVKRITDAIVRVQESKASIQRQVAASEAKKKRSYEQYLEDSKAHEELEVSASSDVAALLERRQVSGRRTPESSCALCREIMRLTSTVQKLAGCLAALGAEQGDEDVELSEELKELLQHPGKSASFCLSTKLEYLD